MFAIVIPSRKTLEDTEIAGCPIPKGSMVCLPLNAATRDDRQYEDAKEVHLDRHPNNHIAFGAGPHRRPGSHLACRELRIALEEGTSTSRTTGSPSNRIPPRRAGSSARSVRSTSNGTSESKWWASGTKGRRTS